MRREETTLVRLLMVRAGMALHLMETLHLMGMVLVLGAKETLGKATPLEGAVAVALRTEVAMVMVVVTTTPLLLRPRVRATRINIQSGTARLTNLFGWR